MTAKEIFKKVRKIEIKTRGLSNQIFSGEYHSVFKGRGMAFSEVREYQYGDDIRNIDWNVTARFNHPFVKIFEEERELTVMLLIDVSGSNSFGTQGQLKQDVVTEIAAVLSFSAINNNDKVGVIFFSDEVEMFIPPKKGRGHILRIIRELLEFQPKGKGTNISEALRYLNTVIKKRSIAFLLSDMMDEGYEDSMKIANRKHDLVAMRIYDPREMELPSMGFVEFVDQETGETQWVNTWSKKVRTKYKAEALRQHARARDAMRRAGVDNISISTQEPYVKPLMGLFKKRGN